MNGYKITAKITEDTLNELKEISKLIGEKDDENSLSYAINIAYTLIKKEKEGYEISFKNDNKKYNVKLI